jgi:hypothetical protein
MGKKHRNGGGKDEHLQVRIDAAEKQAFEDAAKLSGLALSAWVRERLRQVSARELGAAGQPVAFLKRTEDVQSTKVH